MRSIATPCSAGQGRLVRGRFQPAPSGLRLQARSQALGDGPIRNRNPGDCQGDVEPLPDGDAESNVRPADGTNAAMRTTMDELAAASLDAYTATLRDPGFVDFFRAFTAETELSELALGSRPARRTPARDIDSLRAIPWVFAWTQVRLMLPAWLGTERALLRLTKSPGDIDALRSWPFSPCRWTCWRA